MSDLEDCFKFMGHVYFFVAGLFTLCLGISEAVFVAKYDEYDDECRNIRAWIIAACCINIVAPVITACGLYRLADIKDQGHLPVIHSLLGIGQFVISVWSAVTYFNISAMCHDFWVSKAFELWVFVMIHFVALWVNLTFTILYVAFICAGACAGACAAENNDQVKRSNSIYDSALALAAATNNNKNTKPPGVQNTALSPEQMSLAMMGRV